MSQNKSKEEVIGLLKKKEEEKVETMTPLNLSKPNEKKNYGKVKRITKDSLYQHVLDIESSLKEIALDLEDMVDDLNDYSKFPGEKNKAEEYISELIENEKLLIGLVLKIKQKILEE